MADSRCQRRGDGGGKGGVGDLRERRGLLALSRENILQFNLHLPQDRFEFAERDVVLSALNAVERGVREADELPELGVGKTSPLPLVVFTGRRQLRRPAFAATSLFHFRPDPRPPCLLRRNDPRPPFRTHLALLG